MTERKNWLLVLAWTTVVFLVANRRIVAGSVAPIWDAEVQFHPYFDLVADHARAGRLLGWNPWSNAGSPDGFEPQYGARSPLTLAVAAATGGGLGGFRTYWLLLWWLGGAGILVFAARLRAPPWGGAAVALGFLFSGVYAGHAEHTSHLHSLALVPWVLWRLDVAVLDGRPLAAAQAGALLGLSALGGHPSLGMGTAAFSILWAVTRAAAPEDGEHRVRAARVAAAIGAFLVVGAAVAAPLHSTFASESAGYSFRAHALPRAEAIGRNALHPAALIGLASPDVLSLKAARNATLWPSTDVAMCGLYAGGALTALALFALRRAALRLGVTAIAVVFLAVAVGDALPLRGWLYDVVPPTRWVRHAAVFRDYFVLGLAVLAILGARDLASATDAPRAWRRMALVALGAAIAAFAAYESLRAALGAPGPAILARVHLAIAWSGLLVVAAAAARSSRALAIAPLAIVAVASADALLARDLGAPTIEAHPSILRKVRALQTHRRRDVDPGTASVDRAPRPDVHAWLGLPPEPSESNAHLPLRRLVFASYSPLANEYHARFAIHPVLRDVALGARRAWFAASTETVPPNDHAWTGFLRAATALGSPPLVVTAPSRMHEIGDAARTKQLSIGVLPRIGALPAATRLDVSVREYRSDAVRLVARVPTSGWLLWTDRWSAGWRATVNGRAAAVYGGDFLFRAIQVGPGRNDVRMRYRPAFATEGLVLAWGTMGLVALATLLPRRRRS